MRQTHSIPVILIRHAQSQWNLKNRFTGWANPPLTAAGEAEAREAGKRLRALGYGFDAAYSSRLQRAESTLDILLQELEQTDIPRQADWRLNERHYGALQGLNKTEAADKAREYQVWRWRRGYLDKAEPLLRTDPSHPINNTRYANVQSQLLPGVENLAQTRARVAEFWQEQIVPRIQQGEYLLISSHGNTLRALLMELSDMSVDEVESFEIPTATPIVYQFDIKGQPLYWHYLDQAQAA